MKVRTLGVLGAVAALAAMPLSADAEAPRDKATGGGQVILDPNAQPTQGAFDTVAFTAQRAKGATDESGDAIGQVQVNRRLGDEPVKFHGTVQCLIVFGTKSAGKAYISGIDNKTQEPFELYVVDGGSGENERGADQILVWYGPETEENEPDQLNPVTNEVIEEEYCGIEEDPSSKRAIPVQARGNTQVHDANPAAPARRSTTASKLRLSALR